MTTTEAPAFTKAIDGIKHLIASHKQPFELSDNILKQAQARLAQQQQQQTTPNKAWLEFMLGIAASRRKFGTAESPDGFVFTATQLHNYLNSTDSNFGMPCPYSDAVFLALFLCGETKMKHTLESVKHFHGGVIYDENDDEDTENDETDSENDETDSDDDDSEYEQSDDENDEASAQETDAEDGAGDKEHTEEALCSPRPKRARCT